MLSNVISRLKVNFGMIIGKRGSLKGTPQTCTLATGERITSVTAYIWWYKSNYESVGGVTFTTTQKTCGPYGRVTNVVQHFEGHMLLYFAGRNGEVFDQFEPVFDYC